MSIRKLKKINANAIGFGPGLGTHSDKMAFIKSLIKYQNENVVIDADGLTLLSKIKINRLPSSWVLTPHEGEMARLLKITSNQVVHNREKYLQELQRKYGCHIILKGAKTLLINNDGNIVALENAPAALAKAGTGDTLTGILVGLLAQKISTYEAMQLSVALHAEAAKVFIKRNDEVSMRPTDLITNLPIVLKRLRSR